MMKALLVPVMAAGLALGGTAKDATALTAEETAALLAGLVIVGVIASKQNGGRAEASTARSPLSATGRAAREGYGRDQRRALLPVDCLRRFETDRGVRRLVGERCLERNGVRTARLPDTCEVRVRTGRGIRDAYLAGCLERAGYRFDDDRRRHDGRRVLDIRRDRD